MLAGITSRTARAACLLLEVLNPSDTVILHIVFFLKCFCRQAIVDRHLLSGRFAVRMLLQTGPKQDQLVVSVCSGDFMFPSGVTLRFVMYQFQPAS